jgi:hypothetical protein
MDQFKLELGNWHAFETVMEMENPGNSVPDSTKKYILIEYRVTGK